MKRIEKIVTQNKNEIWRIRALMSKLRAQIALHDSDPMLDLDKMKQLLHEIEFDFSDYKFMQEDADTLLEAHNIIIKQEFDSLVEELTFQIKLHKDNPYYHQPDLEASSYALECFTKKSSFITKEVEELLHEAKKIESEFGLMVKDQRQ